MVGSIDIGRINSGSNHRQVEINKSNNRLMCAANTRAIREIWCEKYHQEQVTNELLESVKFAQRSKSVLSVIPDWNRRSHKRA